MGLISGKRNSIGDRFPQNPQKSDRHSEIDAGGFLKETWVYNGDFWIGKELRSSFNLVKNSVASSVILSVDKSWDLFLTKLTLDYLVSGKNDATKYWQFNFYRVDRSYGLTLLKSGNTIAGNYDSLILPLDLQDRLAFNNTLFYSLDITNIGNPGIITLSGSLGYQSVA